MTDKSSKPLEGLVLPKTSHGDRSSTEFGKHVFAASIINLDKNMSQQILSEKHWRTSYPKHIVHNVASSNQSADNALHIATAGLDYIHKHIEFFREGKVSYLSQAMDSPQYSFHTGFIKGNGQPQDTLTIPYKGRELKQESLLRQLRDWAKVGTIEPAVVKAFQTLLGNSWFDLSKMYFVLLGAGAAMGPFETLLSLGANIIAIDIPKPTLWRRLIKTVKSSSGSLTFPLREPQNNRTKSSELAPISGCDLLTQTPEIARWISELYPDQTLNIGTYAYMDGEAHVRVATAMDAILLKLMSTRPKLAFTCLPSPTDCYYVSESIYQDSKRRLQNIKYWHIMIRELSGRRLMKPQSFHEVKNDQGQIVHLVNSMVLRQGPNYSLAKRIQYWRSIVTKMTGKYIVSANVAPSSSTLSVTHNTVLAAAYGGAHNFEPVEIFAPETSNSLMTGLLIHDLRNPQSIGQPHVKLDHPYAIFERQALHGGLWRAAFELASTAEVSAMLYWLEKYKPHYGLPLVAFSIHAYRARL